MQNHGLRQPVLGTIGSFLASGGGNGALVGLAMLVASAVCLLVWGTVDGGAVREMLRAQHRVPHPRVRNGSLLAASFATFLRDASNRVGVVAMFALCVFGAWIESIMGVDLALLITSGLMVLLTSASALYAYGGYLAIRWRVLSSPMSPRRALGAWVSGHLLAGIACSFMIGVFSLVFSPRQFMSIDLPYCGQMLFVCCLAISFSLIAGRVLPYDRNDLASFASASTLGMVLTLGAWWGLGGVGLLAQMLAGIVVLVLSITVVLHAEPKPCITSRI